MTASFLLQIQFTSSLMNGSSNWAMEFFKISFPNWSRKILKIGNLLSQPEYFIACGHAGSPLDQFVEEDQYFLQTTRKRNRVYPYRPESYSTYSGREPK